MTPELTLDDVVTMLVTARRNPQARERIVGGLLVGEPDPLERTKIVGAICDGLLGFVDDTLDHLASLTIDGTGETVEGIIMRRIREVATRRAAERE